MRSRLLLALVSVICICTFWSDRTAAQTCDSFKTETTQNPFCDPQNDPDECGCPTDLKDFDTCDEIKIGNMIAPDDPAAVRKAANINAEWDSERELYAVSIDALAYNVGFVPVTKGHGNWSSVDELSKYVHQLLGIGYDEGAPIPEFDILQNGTSVRLDIDQGRWLPSSGSLLYDLISTSDGTVRIGGEILISHPPGCPTPATASYVWAAGASSRAYDGPFGSSMCIGHLGIPFNQHQHPDRVSFYSYLNNFTSDLTVPTFDCTRDDVFGWQCEVTDSSVVRRFGLKADVTRFDKGYYDDGTEFATSPSDPVYDTRGIQSALGTENDNGTLLDDFGMCGKGTAERNGYRTEHELQEGGFDPSSGLCKE